MNDPGPPARSRTRERLIALALAGALALNFPLLDLFDRAALLLGVPVLFLYLFGAWAALIGLTALITDRPRRRPRRRRDPG